MNTHKFPLFQALTTVFLLAVTATLPVSVGLLIRGWAKGHVTLNVCARGAPPLRSIENGAVPAATRFLRNHPVTEGWTHAMVTRGRINCGMLGDPTQNNPWALCSFTPPDGNTTLVVDCDTAETNNIGCWTVLRPD